MAPTLCDVDYDKVRDDLPKALETFLCNLLAVPGPLDHTSSLMALGVNSTMAMRLRATLQVCLEIPINMRVVVIDSSIAAISSKLDELLSRVPVRAAPVPRKVPFKRWHSTDLQGASEVQSGLAATIELALCKLLAVSGPLDQHASLMKLGMNSTMMMHLRSSLQAQVGIQIRMQVIMLSDSIADIRCKLSDELAKAPPKVACKKTSSRRQRKTLPPPSPVSPAASLLRADKEVNAELPKAVETLLCNILAVPGPLDHDVPLMKLGVNSTMTMHLRGGLQACLGIPINMRVVNLDSSIADVSKKLVDQLSKAPSSGPSQPKRVLAPKWAERHSLLLDAPLPMAAPQMASPPRPGGLAPLLEAEEEPTAPEVPDDLLESVEMALCELLAVSGPLNYDTPLWKFGANSTMTMHLRKNLQVKFGVRMSIKVVLLNSSIREIGARISVLLPKVPAAATKVEAASAPVLEEQLRPEVLQAAELQPGLAPLSLSSDVEDGDAEQLASFGFRDCTSPLSAARCQEDVSKPKVPVHMLQSAACSCPLIYLVTLQTTWLKLARLSSRDILAYASIGVGHSQGIASAAGMPCSFRDFFRVPRVVHALFLQGMVEQYRVGLRHFVARSSAHKWVSGMVSLRGAPHSMLSTDHGYGNFSIINSETSVVCSGCLAPRLLRRLAEDDEVTARGLPIPFPAHSRELQPAFEHLREKLRTTAPLCNSRVLARAALDSSPQEDSRKDISQEPSSALPVHPLSGCSRSTDTTSGSAWSSVVASQLTEGMDFPAALVSATGCFRRCTVVDCGPAEASVTMRLAQSSCLDIDMVSAVSSAGRRETQTSRFTPAPETTAADPLPVAKSLRPGLAATAIVDDAAQISLGARIEDFAYVEAGAVVQANAVVESYAVIRSGAVIGEGCRVGTSTEVGARVELSANNVIGRCCNLGGAGRVRLGTCNKIGPHCRITAGFGVMTVIGNDNECRSHVSIGNDPEDFEDFPKPAGDVRIGNSNTFCENVVVHAPYREIESPVTSIGNNCYLMANAHVAHDNILEDRVVLAAGACLDGCVRVMYKSNLGIGSLVHQDTTIGPYCIVGMGTPVTNDVLPFTTYLAPDDCPEGSMQLNTIGLSRAGKSDDEIAAVEDFYVSGYNPSLENLASQVSEGMWFKEVFQSFDHHRRQQRRGGRSVGPILFRM